MSEYDDEFIARYNARTAARHAEQLEDAKLEDKYPNNKPLEMNFRRAEGNLFGSMASEESDDAAERARNKPDSSTYVAPPPPPSSPEVIALISTAILMVESGHTESLLGILKIAARLAKGGQ